MNDVLLINKINHNDYTKEKKRVFFLIGQINTPRVKEELMDLLSSTKLVDMSELVLKYNGVEVEILVQSIPIMIKLLSDANIDIYSVYPIYNPEKKRI